MKKIVSLFLAALLVLGVLAGCNGSSANSNYTDDESKTVTLKIAFPNAKQRDTDKVVAAINEKLKDYLPNTEIELMMEPDMETKWSLWMSTKKTMDLAHSGFINNLEDEVRKDSFCALNDLIDEYAPTLKELKEKYWYSYDCATVGGELYAVPNTQAYTKDALAIDIWKEGKPYFDTKAIYTEAITNDKTTEKFWQLLDDGIQKALTAGVDCTELFTKDVYIIAQKGYNFVGGAGSNLCYDNSDDAKIIDFYTTDEFKIFCQYMKKWADQGLISEEILTGQWQSKLYVRQTFSYGLDKETGTISLITENTDEIVRVCITNTDDFKLVRKVGENYTYWSIPFTAKNPVRAIKFLDLLNSKEGAEIVNMLAYGIEGEHYEFTDKEKGEIKAYEYLGQGDAGSSYGIPCWEVSNMLEGMYTVAPYDSDMWDWARDYYTNKLNTLEKHILYDFDFDTEPVKANLSKILKNNAEYIPSIYCGLSDKSETLYNELVEKNKQANFTDVMEEIQSQVDEFLSSK